MQSPCYRCGTPVEEGSAFCPSCNAPQIKVAVPQSSATEPSTRPPEPGATDMVLPEVLPASVQPTDDIHQKGEIQWKKYRRLALPLSLLAGAGIAWSPPLGLLFFVGSIVFGVGRYRRENPSPLRASQGAKMGAVNGFISFVVAAGAAVLQAAMNFDEYRKQAILPLQQRYAGNPDPRLQQLVHWASTDQGFIILYILSLVFLLAIFLIVSSFIGAVSVSFSSNRDRS